MSYFKAFIVLERLAMVLLSMAASLEATSPSTAAMGFIAPLIHRTSPKSPFYNPHVTHMDIVRENQLISAERESYFNQQRGFGRLDVAAPISLDVVMSYELGTPPVQVFAIPDTGSDLIWLKCQVCCQENQTTIAFDPTLSTTYNLVACPSPDCKQVYKSYCGSKDNPACLYKISYGGHQSSNGIIGRDTFNLPGDDFEPDFINLNTLFGCGIVNVGSIGEGIAGVVGLQNTSVSLAGQIQSGSFSYCKSKSKGGGFICFGSSAMFVGNSTVLFTNSFGQYQVILKGLAIGNAGNLNVSSDIFKMVEGNPRTGVEFDSGTPYTRLHPVAFDALIYTIKQKMGRYEGYSAAGFSLCYNGDKNPEIKLETMPSIRLLLQGLELSLPSENIWTEKDNFGDICLGIIRSTSNRTLIGSEQLNSYNVGFDLRGNLIWFDYQPNC